METLVVYTDGACPGNHLPWHLRNSAGIGLHFPDGQAADISEALTDPAYFSNNEAELEAARVALDVAWELGFGSVEVRTDSAFLVGGMTQWWPRWLANGFRKSSGAPLANAAAWRRMEEAMEGLRVRWIHVPHARNTAADRLAKDAANGY